MKFACDRCKTRYSIADERVRGKILKIRCKACANVITVKEGMESPVEHERAQRPTTMAPHTTVGSGGAAPSTPAPAPAPALVAAFASAMATPQAPPQLEDEWYVSRDGEQQGPFALPNAQAWVSQQPYDAELYCWCEGFDDWLPVDRIAHFRGLRPRPVPPGAPPRAASPAPTALAPPPPAHPPAQPAPQVRMASGPLPALGDHAPARPAAAIGRTGPIAAMTQTGPVPVMGAGAPGAASGSGADRPRTGQVPITTAAAATSAKSATSGPIAAMRSGPMSVMNPGPAAVLGVGASPAFAATPAPVPADDKPLFAATMAALDGGGPSAGHQGPGQNASTANGTPAHGGLTFGAPSAAMPAPGGDGLGPARNGFAAPAFDTGDLGSQGFSPTASSSGLRAAALGATTLDDDDEDLEFGEVSRVVRIADIGKAAPPRKQQGRNGTAAQATRRTAANEALPAPVGWPPAPASGPTPGPGMPLSPGAAVLDLANGRSEVPVVTAARQHRNHALLLGLVAVGLIGAGVLALVLLQRSGPEDPSMLSLSDRNVSDLTIRPDDPRRPHGDTGPGPSGPGGAVPRPGTGGKRPGTPGTGSGAVTAPLVPGGPVGPGGGKVETTPTPGVLTPLGGDEVEEMSQRNSSGLQRCYEQALKKDIFLEVKSIKVTISIDNSGVVTSVGMSSHAEHVLGQCMISRIRNWRFRANSRGLDAKFTVAFGRT